MVEGHSRSRSNRKSNSRGSGGLNIKRNTSYARRQAVRYVEATSI